MLIKENLRNTEKPRKEKKEREKEEEKKKKNPKQQPVSYWKTTKVNVLVLIIF